MTNAPQQGSNVGFAVRYLNDRQVNFVIVAEGASQPLFDLKLGPAEAAVLGRSLLAASAVCRSLPPKPASGSVVTDCHFPVLRWETGVSSANHSPVLRVTVPGGVPLTFEVTKDVAKAFGAALAAEGKRNKPPRQRDG